MRSRISFRRVSELVSKEADVIVLDLSNQNFGFDEYMSASSMSDDLIILFAQVLDKGLSQCNSMKQNKLKLIEKMVESNYLKKHLYRTIEKKDVFGNYFENLIINTINICHAIISAMPSSRFTIEPITERIELIVKIRMKKPELASHYDEKIAKLKEEENRIEKSKANDNNQVARSQIITFTNTNDHLDPPDRIIDISIAPTLEEINKEGKPFLRRNIIKGPFKDVKHYLDIHFRLLREDFMQPLRKGIAEFKNIIKEANKNANRNNVDNSQALSKEIEAKVSKIESLYVYQNVSFVANLCVDSGVTYSIKLDTSKMRAVNWEFSKRLLYGSLVCLSNDYFTTNLIVAIIYDRDAEKLKKGLLSVKIDSNTMAEDDNEALLKSKYVMLETSAYFEAYRHVLNALCGQYRVDDQSFPFKRELIDCHVANIDSPRYFMNAYIDFRPIVDKNKQFVNDRSTGTVNYQFDSQSDYAKACHAQYEREWPSPKQLHLDESQYEALKIGLTKKIAIIQGFVFK